jgi:hypothetical protein
MLYTEADLETSMDKIETINFHEEKDVFGIKFWAYNAGHVLGAAMFMIEIAGVKVLTTQDPVDLCVCCAAKNKITSNKNFLASQLPIVLCAIILNCQEFKVLCVLLNHVCAFPVDSVHWRLFSTRGQTSDGC